MSGGRSRTHRARKRYEAAHEAQTAKLSPMPGNPPTERKDMSRMNRKEAPPSGHGREAFEAFIRREPHYIEFADLDNVLTKHRGEYLDPLIKGAWMAWNQRAEQLPF